MRREFDVIVWGATGFTGALVAGCLLARHGARRGLRWAVAGRSANKLTALRDRLENALPNRRANALDLLTADAADVAAMRRLSARTKVMCTTVGPYARYGTPLVEACVAEGTHYCDLAGEVHWIQRMIERMHAPATSTGARIVFSCGFGSIPSDLGVHFVQREMRARHRVVARHVKYRARDVFIGMGGGSAASLFTILEESDRDPGIRRVFTDPYALNPPGLRSGADGPDTTSALYDTDFRSWTAPTLLSAINTRVVRRTNALLGYPYGRDFRYDEASLMPGFLSASAMSVGLHMADCAAALTPLRRFMTSFLPRPGEGPSAAQRAPGHFDIGLLAIHPSNASRDLRATITGDRDPGHGSTAEMLAESALCLAQDDLSIGGGCWTPAAAMGDALLRRLIENAGLRFTLDN